MTPGALVLLLVVLLTGFFVDFWTTLTISREKRVMTSKIRTERLWKKKLVFESCRCLRCFELGKTAVGTRDQ